MKIVVFASLASSLINFRGKLLAAMVANGHDVVACAPEDDTGVIQQLAAIGVGYRVIPMARTGLNPFADLSTLRAMVRVLRAERPDVLMAYTQKPIIYGGMAARLTGVPAFHAMVSGLGHAFTDEKKGGGLLRRLVATLYRIGVRGADSVIVFNADDRTEMLRYRIITPSHRVVQVPGSGVDIGRFRPAAELPWPPVFLLVARLLRNKGIAQFAAAARQVKAMHPEARFRLLGPLDCNPAGVSAAEIDAWVAEGVVDYLGETGDIAPYLSAATVFVLPTWYREGLPRTILEAMASGLPIITTDAPGCRETVEIGANGLLVPVRDERALAEAMATLAGDRDLVRRMGIASRAKAIAQFDVELVNDLLLRTMALRTTEPVVQSRVAA